ncbi:MAG: S8 family serine peptidase, partial [Candidatus Tectomicrobia bacterium]|nr:S8 family serine peptidase [Candidatus Tectomicrobia bacterium]
MPGRSGLLNWAVGMADAAGILFVAAAGNEGADNDESYVSPANLDFPNVIAVAASDQSDNLLGSSNFGATSVDLAAPGISIRSTARGGGYRTLFGTSAATPHVAGVAALLWDEYTHATCSQIKHLILSAVDSVPSHTNKTVTGGRLNAFQAFDPELWDLFPDMAITSNTPANNALIRTALVEFALAFTDPYDSASLDAADFKVNGIPADHAIIPTSAIPDTVTFIFDASPLVANGPQTMSVSTGSISRLIDGRGVLAWSAPFDFDARTMQVVSTEPSADSVVPPGSPLSLRIHLNETYDPDAVQIGDIQLNQGVVSGLNLIDGDTIEYMIIGVVDGLLAFEIMPGAWADSFGLPNPLLSGGFVVDADEVSLPEDLRAMPPWGSLIYEQKTLGAISHEDDVDRFTMDINDGQTVALVLDPAALLELQVALLDPSGASLGAVSSAAGQDAMLGPLMTSGGAGTHTIEISSAGTSTGAYTLVTILNAAKESEQHGGAANDTRLTAEDLDASFVTLTGVSKRGAVIGRLPRTRSDSNARFHRANFRSGVFGPAWSAYSSAGGGLGDSNRNGVIPAGVGQYKLGLAAMEAGERGVIKEAIWTVDLSGLSDMELRFDYGGLGLERATFGGNFFGHFPADGIAVSEDGVYWTPVWTPPHEDYVSGVYSVDLPEMDCERCKVKFQLYARADEDPQEIQVWEDIAITALAAPVEQPPPSEDWYSFTAQADERVSLLAAAFTPAATLSAEGAVQVELYDDAGVLLAQRESITRNVTSYVTEFLAPHDGRYHARVKGHGEYSLVVTRNVTFHVEYPEEASPSNLQDISASGIVLGMHGPAVVPWQYSSFRAEPGEIVTMRTHIPLSGPHAIENGSDPTLTLMDATLQPLAHDDNGAPDGRNAKLTYVVSQTGTQIVFVGSAQTAGPEGEYLLEITRNGSSLTVGDFNVDGTVDDTDINLLAEALRNGASDLRLDLNGDGVVDTGDREYLVTDIIDTSLGDVDLSGSVDLLDASKLLGNVNGSGQWGDGDLSGDSLVDEADRGILEAHFSAAEIGLSIYQGSPAGRLVGTAVPQAGEPGIDLDYAIATGDPNA